VQLRCCNQNNKQVNITSCEFSGHRYLPAPWDTKIRTNYELGTAAGTTRQAIQTFEILCVSNAQPFLPPSSVFRDGFIQARLCQYSIAKVDIIGKFNAKQSACKFMLTFG